MWRNRNENRINERDVPESRHTIFIRGLPGSMSTDEIRDFFEKDHGSCSFDFVKMSPDRTKLYVAIRFDSKSSAREVMEKYSSEGELLGYKVELSWFRDIRRYLAHCAKQGIRPSRFRNAGGGQGGGRGGGDFRRNGGGQGGGGGGYRARARSRSPPGGHSRSASRSSKDSRGSYSRSASAESRSLSRSKSASSAARSATPHSERERSLDYSDIVVKKERPPTPSPSPPPPPPPKKSRKDKKKREKERERKATKAKKRPPPSPSPSPSPERQSSVLNGTSDMEASDGEVMAINGKQQQQATKILIGPKQPSSPPRQQQVIFSHRHLTAGTLADAFMAKQNGKTNNNNGQPILMDLSDAKNTVTPRFKPIGDTSSIDYLLNGTNKERARMGSELSSSPPPSAHRNTSEMAMGNCGTGAALNNFKEIQRMILHDVRYKPHEDAGDEDGGSHMGSLRLSSLSRKAQTDEKREERVAKLSPELRERVNKKKRQLELSYRSDCETYGLVANKLIAKDRSLEDRVKMALLETMRELEQETMKQLDDFLDQINFMF